MTTGQFGEVDFDRLADYVGGALEGTAEVAAVAKLIQEDPAWAQAHAELVEAVGTVQESLVGLGSLDLSMPPEVTARLTAAITEAHPKVTAGARSGLTAVPGGSTPTRRRDRGIASRKRHWPRWAMPLGVATAVAAVATLGVSQLTVGTGADNASVAGGTERALDSTTDPGTRTALQPSANRLLASGNDYTVATLPEEVDALDRNPLSTTPGVPPIAASSDANPSLFSTDALQRLTDPVALTDCLETVGTAHQREPLVVELVDYATFEGAPALLIVFSDAAETRWAWVVGPDCGHPGSGPDIRHRTRVG